MKQPTGVAAVRSLSEGLCYCSFVGRRSFVVSTGDERKGEEKEKKPK